MLKGGMKGWESGGMSWEYRGGGEGDVRLGVREIEGLMNKIFH